MAWLEELTRAVADRDALLVSALVHDLARTSVAFEEVPKPNVSIDLLPLAAGIVDLLAERRGAHSPAWSSSAGVLQEPFYTLKYAGRVPRLRRQCEAESPEALKRRNVFALSQFLTSA